MKAPRKRNKPSREPEQQAKLPGEIRYRPPTGKASDRALNRLRTRAADGAGDRQHNGHAK
jgi:hypothetical protein